MSNADDLARKKIIERLAELGKSRNWLAEQSGMAGSNLKRYLDGDAASITMASMASIARALGFRPWQLIADETAPVVVPADPPPRPTAIFDEAIDLLTAFQDAPVEVQEAIRALLSLDSSDIAGANALIDQSQPKAKPKAP